MDSRSEMEPSGSQAASQALVPSKLAWVAGWLTIVALAVWVALLTAPVLLLAAAGTVAWAWGARHRRDGWYLATLLALSLATGLATGVQYQLGTIARDWPTLQASIEAKGAARLNTSLDELVERGEMAVAGVSRIVEGREAVS